MLFSVQYYDHQRQLTIQINGFKSDRISQNMLPKNFASKLDNIFSYNFAQIAGSNLSFHIFFQGIPMKAQQKKLINEIEHFKKIRPKPLSNFPSTLILTLNNKEDLRSIITDYILHNIEIEKQCKETNPLKKDKNDRMKKQCSQGSSFKKNKSKHPININYPSITLTVSVNHVMKTISIDLLLILKIYTKLSEKIKFQTSLFESRFQPMIVDILNFIDSVEEEIKGVDFQIPEKYILAQTSKKQLLKSGELEDSQKVVSDQKLVKQLATMIIQRHLKEKNKIKFTFQDKENESSSITAKHMRVSYIDVSDHLKTKEKQFTLEIRNANGQKIGTFLEEKNEDFAVIPCKITDISEKLKQLLQCGNFIQEPEKLEKIKKEALIRFYETDETDFIQKKSKFKDEVDNAYLPFTKNAESPSIFNPNSYGNDSSKTTLSFTSNNEETISLIKNWLIDIEVSQSYYQQKFGKNKRSIAGQKKG